MSGSTITGYVSQTVILGTATYPSPLTITSTGTIESTQPVGVYGAAGLSNPTVVNNGSVIGSAAGVDLRGAGAEVTNTGFIYGASDFGIVLYAGGTVDNTTGAIEGANGIVVEYDRGAVFNTGLVQGTGGDGVDMTAGGLVLNLSANSKILGDTTGVQIVGSVADVVNFGTISGDNLGIALGAYGGVGYVNNTGAVALIMGGVIGVGVQGGPGLVFNQRTITGTTSFGVSLADGGTVYNTGAGAMINGGVVGVVVGSAYGTVANGGTITGTSNSGVLLEAGGSVGNYGHISGGIYGVRIDGAGAVRNAGSITAGGTANTNAGIVFTGAGYVGNTLTTALISGYNGIVFDAEGTVANAGTIIGNADNGVFLGLAGTVINTGTAAYIYGAQFGVGISGSVAYVGNAGTISGVSTGVLLTLTGTGTGTVVNTGTAALITGDVGVGIVGYGGTVLNAGTIMGNGEVGVDLTAGGSVRNTGAYARITGTDFGIFSQQAGATVQNAGTINGGEGGVYLKAGGYVNNQNLIAAGDIGVVIEGNGTVINTGQIMATGAYGVAVEGADGYVTNGSAAALLSGGEFGVLIEVSGTGQVVNDGIIQGGDEDGIALVAAAGVVTNAGTILGAAYAVVLHGTTSNQLIVDVGAGFIGYVAATTTATNTLELSQGPAAGAGALFGIGSQFTGFGTIDFDAGTDWTLGGDIAGLGVGQVINGFTFGDTIDLSGIAASSESFANNILTLFSGVTELAMLNLNELSTTNTQNFEIFADGSGGTDIVMDMPCFASGTKILTPAGEVNVEDIRVGDTVITVRENGPTTGRVTWIGRRSLDISRHPNKDALHPIRIIAGAFAPGLPERDLRLSPHHALYIDGVLMEAVSLVNGATVIQEFDTRFVTYHHIALESHDVILAEGLPAETYLETGHRNMFEGEASMVLHPNFKVLGDADFCAPMIRAGAQLETTRARLLARAEALGFTKTDALDLIAQTNGQTLQAA
jgi:hypothetical protein